MKVTDGMNKGRGAENYHLPDLNGIDADVEDLQHEVQKRKTQWKACGFDSSALQIKDPWAKRNLWFQQLTHSVRSVSGINGPCVVKIPTPAT